MRIFSRVGKAITWTNEKLGKATSLLIYPLMLVLVFEVLMRYFFMLPTRYSYSISTMLYITFVTLGAGYAFHRNAHVSVDIFYNKLKRRAKIIINLISYPAFFFIFIGAVLDVTFRYMIFAITYGELPMQSPWRYYMWPIRTIMFIGILMLFLQGIVKFVESLKGENKGEKS
jgi:TRAP-type mannitol/chloroaromatic compound transport system permease small subunit